MKRPTWKICGATGFRLATRLRWLLYVIRGRVCLLCLPVQEIRRQRVTAEGNARQNTLAEYLNAFGGQVFGGEEREGEKGRRRRVPVCGATRSPESRGTKRDLRRRRGESTARTEKERAGSVVRAAFFALNLLLSRLLFWPDGEFG